MPSYRLEEHKGCRAMASLAHRSVVPTNEKAVVKIGLSLGMPPRFYGRISAGSGLVFIDIGEGFIDKDYRGEVGVTLFNCANENFDLEMVDKVSRLMFKKIISSEMVEVESLYIAARGIKEYGNIGIQSISQGTKTRNEKLSESSQSSIDRIFSECQ